MNKKFIARLSDEERGVCQEIIKNLKGSSQKFRRAQILLKADADGPGWIDGKIAEAFNCRVQSVLAAKVRDFEIELCVANINDDNDRENMIENRQCLESAPERMAQKRWPKPKRFQRSIQPK